MPPKQNHQKRLSVFPFLKRQDFLASTPKLSDALSKRKKLPILWLPDDIKSILKAWSNGHNKKQTSKKKWNNEELGNLLINGKYIILSILQAKKQFQKIKKNKKTLQLIKKRMINKTMNKFLLPMRRLLYIDESVPSILEFFPPKEIGITLLR